MTVSRSLSRREVLVLLGGASVAITAACGGGGSSSPTSPSSNPPVSAGDKEASSISANHGHTAVIKSAELQAGGGLTLNIRGNANHPHSLALSADEVVSIRNGGRVSKESSNDEGHTHTVTFN